MEDKAISILERHRIMSIATIRPDGWPQNTVVGYANDGLLIYFLISRGSQKLANIMRDERIAIAVAEEPDDVRRIEAVYAGAIASEVTDERQRADAWRLLGARHPNLAGFQMPDSSQAALMRAMCKHVSVLNFREGLGHTDEFTVGAPGFATMAPARADDWGLSGLEPKPPTEPGE